MKLFRVKFVFIFILFNDLSLNLYFLFIVCIIFPTCVLFMLSIIKLFIRSNIFYFRYQNRNIRFIEFLIIIQTVDEIFRLLRLFVTQRSDYTNEQIQATKEYQKTVLNLYLRVHFIFLFILFDRIFKFNDISWLRRTPVTIWKLFFFNSLNVIITWEITQIAS